MRAFITNGELLYNKENLAKLKDGEVEIKKIGNTRRNQQNKYYWAVIIAYLCDHLGYTDVEMHSIIKDHFLSSRFSFKYKEIEREISHQKSTSKLTTVEFEDLMSEIRAWASSEFSIYIPLPNEETDD